MDGRPLAFEPTGSPTTLKLRRGQGYFRPGRYRITFEREGYASTSVDVVGRINGEYVYGNLFLGGIPGYLIVDPLFGGMWDLDPPEIDTPLQKSSD